jgi:hypothetical protein
VGGQLVAFIVLQMKNTGSFAMLPLLQIFILPLSFILSRRPRLCVVKNFNGLNIISPPGDMIIALAEDRRGA